MIGNLKPGRASLQGTPDEVGVGHEPGLLIEPGTASCGGQRLAPAYRGQSGLLKCLVGNPARSRGVADEVYSDLYVRGSF